MKILDALVEKIVANPRVQKWAEDKFKAYIIETLTRFLSSNPKYVNIANWTNTIIGTLALVLTHLAGIQHLLTPNELIWIGKILPAITYAMTIYGQMSVQPTVTGLADNGTVTKQDVIATRPFTAIVEKQAAAQIIRSQAISGKEKEAAQMP